MTKRVTSVIVIVSLSLSIFFGGLGLSLRSANALVSDDQLILREVIASGRENLTGSNLTLFESIISTYIEPQFDNTNYLICVCCPTTTFDPDIWHMTIYRGYEGGNLWYMNSSGYFSNYKSGATYAYTDVWQVADVICNVSESYYTVGMPSGNGNWESYINNLPKFSFNGSGSLAAPCGQTFTSSSCGTWMNRDIRKLYDDYGILHNANMILEIPLIHFELLVFWLGERRYLTIKDQALVRQLSGNEQYNYVLAVSYDYDVEVIEDLDLILYDYNDSILLQYSGVESQLSNISPAGVYAFDITSLDYNRIVYADIDDLDDYDGEDFRKVGEASNVPIILQDAAPEPGTGGTPDSYSNSWNNFITYINNYDTTQLIPDNLVDTIFGVNGFKLYPVDVSLPSSTIPSGNPVTTNIHTYKYHFGSLPADIGLNYDLMDVCIIPKSLTGNYGLVFFYDDTLAAANKFVDYVDYKDLLEQFDLIIVIDDTLEALQENAWWEIIVPNDVWSHVDYMAVSGSSSLGIQYTSDPLPGNIESGFCIVTKRAIQRQQLFLFNDGITKSYKLMSEFVEKHGLWENSFFQWSQSIFYELQTIGGRTNDIYNLLVGLNLGDVLDNISRQLERIADNTSEEDPGYWFLSLWNFVSRFSVSDLDFANWVENYDDFESQIPLPNEDVTPIPIPTITSEVG